MIRRIELENYMSHAHTVIEPAEGLTVLAGPNNCGKSAVVSALMTLCRYESGDYMVRHGAKVARVRVETDDGHTFLWQRRGEVVSYEIDGRPVHRLNRAVPEDLHDHLRLPLVVAGDSQDSFDIHFGEQKAPLFLLDQPESKTALFFASSSDAALLIQMQESYRRRLSEAKADEKRLSEHLRSVEAEIEALGPVDTLLPEIDSLEAKESSLRASEAQIAALGTALFRIEECKDRAVGLALRSELLSTLSPPPALEDERPLTGLVSEIIRRHEESARREALAEALRPLAPPPALEETRPLEEITAKLRSHAEEIARRTLAREAIVRDIAAVVEQVREAVRREPLCRLCGQTIDADRFLAQAQIEGHACG